MFAGRLLERDQRRDERTRVTSDFSRRGVAESLVFPADGSACSPAVYVFEGRDTAPSLDIRSLFKGVLADHLGVDRRSLDTVVFPDSNVAAPAAGLVA